MIPPILVIDLQRFHPDHVGEIPSFLDTWDQRPAREQFQERYVYGGWRPQDGFKTRDGRPTLYYPGDPPLHPLACMALRDEVIFIYPHGYVAIFQPDGSFEACRMD
jgi:hypothetical protein